MTAGIHPGQWRLARVEVVNWGTFHGHYRIDVARKGHLFTGASGSGKSSLLDAMASVLTPDRWLRFNAAAQDATSRSDDRTLVSYVRGAWTNEADEHEDRARSAFLRKRATWSGVLLRFENLGDAPVTVARLFHVKGTSTDKSAIRDLCLIDRGDTDLMALKEYADEGIDVRRLKAARPDAVVTSNMSHKTFYARLCRTLGIGSVGALHLLHKTQSAKNLGSLDHLFRTFMLEEPETFSRARNAVEQFGELDRAHRHVVEHRQQAEQLRELETAIRSYEAANQDAVEAERLAELIEPFQARLTLQLAESDRAKLLAHVARLSETCTRAAEEAERAEERWLAAERHAFELGGDDVERERDRLAEAERAADATAERWSRFAGLLHSVGIDSAPTTSVEFAELSATAQREVAASAPAELHRHDDNETLFSAQRDLRGIDAELEALKKRRSNLPPALLLARHRLAEELGLREQELPFVGELVEVLPEHASWTGAIERVLHPIAIALAVRDDLLVAVRRWIDREHIGARLVYESVPAIAPAVRRAGDARSLLHRIRVADGAFHDWVQARLSAEYDVACVDSADELDGVERGVTITGQIKKSSRRYEKDDRFRIDDRGRWILGADNDAKIDFLIEQRRAAQRRWDAADVRLRQAQEERDSVVRRRSVFEQVLRHDWSELDRAVADRRVRDRRALLEEKVGARSPLSDALARRDEAKASLDEARAASGTSAGALATAVDAREKLDEQVARLEASVRETTLDDVDRAALDARYHKGQRAITRDSIDRISRDVQSTLFNEANVARRRQNDAEGAFIEGATAFKTKWIAAADLTPHIADRAGYLELLERIVTRGLPDHEANFLKLLRERSREHVGLLASDLRDAPKLVVDRIDPVNASLATSSFDVERFLRIDVKVSRSNEVTTFMDDLRTITQGSWANEDLASAERRFDTLARVMAKLESSENADVMWRRRVLDTREHVTFVAKEIDLGGRVVNIHESSAGLSGGQRQKLVVFCLAAALRYQLTADEEQLPSYATIILDEAFDKADSRYTRMAMDVFREFGFHLLLATPQKLLQTIEPYVGAVTTIDNPTRQLSMVANLSFEELADGGA
ncbi:hypothetical protein LG322_01080 [Microbacterium aerolatum]|uniref:ATP-binding protein n=1 Tax=Microbacterium aerolatum TaxID=153731 RepID=UPI00384D2C36